MNTDTVMVGSWTSGPVTTPNIAYERAASIENPAVPITDAIDYLDGGYSNSASGYSVNHATVFYNSAVWQAVSRISQDVSKLKLTLYRRTDDDGREKARREPAYRLVRNKANSELTALRFWRRMLVHKLIWGNAYALILRNRNGQPTELLPLLPDRTEPRRRDGVLSFVSEVDFRLVEIPAADVLHLEGLSCDNLMGMDPCKAMREAVGVALGAMGFAARFFRMGGRGGGILEVPAATSLKGKKVLEEGFSKTYESVDAAFKTVILRDGAKFHMAQANMRDTQMIEGRRESVRDVARYFNLMPSKLGEESTVSYGSKSEDNRDYLDTTLDPHLCEIAAECDDKLLSAGQKRNDSHYFEHNVDGLLRMNMRERAAVYNLGIQGMWMTRNEARRSENLPTYDGGDEFINPAITQPGQQDEPAEEEPAPDAVEAAARALNKTARDAAKSMCAKLLRTATTGAGLCKWLDKHSEQELNRLGIKCANCTGLVDELMGLDEGHTNELVQGKVISKILEPVKRIADTENEDTFRAALESLVGSVGGMDFTGD